MLIIFDLDDTLIDTSGSITPQILENAIHAMQKGGLRLADPKEALKRFLHINKGHITSDDSLKEFIKLTKAPDICYDLGRKEIYESPSLPKIILPVEGAVELLEELADAHTLALVTKGAPMCKEKRCKKRQSMKIFLAMFSFVRSKIKNKFMKKSVKRQKFLQKIHLSVEIEFVSI